MTEYDYSPEGYERHLETQARIERWVDNAERKRSEFQSPFISTPRPEARGPNTQSYEDRSRRSSPAHLSLYPHSVVPHIHPSPGPSSYPYAPVPPAPVPQVIYHPPSTRRQSHESSQSKSSAKHRSQTSKHTTYVIRTDSPAPASPAVYQYLQPVPHAQQVFAHANAGYTGYAVQSPPQLRGY